MVEHTAVNRRVEGSSPSVSARDEQLATLEQTLKKNSAMLPAPLAQMVEHLTFNQGVVGSNPAWRTNYLNFCFLLSRKSLTSVRLFSVIRVKWF